MEFSKLIRYFTNEALYICLVASYLARFLYNESSLIAFPIVI